MTRILQPPPTPALPRRPRSWLAPWPPGQVLLPAWPAYGQRLRAVLAEEAAFALLPPGATSWVAGGCHTLALALRPLVPGAALYLLGGGGLLAQHIVLRVAPAGFLDGDGAATRRTLLERWHRRERVTAPFLHPYDATLLGRDFDPAPPALVAQLTHFLRTRLADEDPPCVGE